MKTILHKSRATGYLLFLFLLTVSFSWGQGMEDFTNSNAGSSYGDEFFVGNNGITWTYVHSRDANGDANSSGINLPALMLRRVNDGSKITSSEIPNGIGNFSVKLYKGFTGGGNRQVELFVNGISQGTSDAFDDYNEHVFEVNNINIDGNITIEIINVTSRQIIIDDIIWTSFGGGGNTGPFIANIAHNPSNVTSSDDVTISADIIDADGVASAQLHWGTTSGSLSNTLAMTVEVNDTYTATIPAQADGTVVYYEIEATDANASPETTTSPEQSYTVEDPLPFGIPYANALRTNDDFADAEALGFLFDNASITNPGTNKYVRIINGSITTPAIDFSAYDGLAVSFGLGNYGGNTGQELSVLVSDDNGSTYTALGVFSHDSSTPATFEQVIDLTSLNGTNGRIKFEMTAGSNSFRFRDLEIVESQEGNVGPVITNIEHNPLVVTSTDAVVVSAEITDLDGIASAELRWGTTTGTLTNVVPMSLDIDDTYTATIPAQADGTVVYYEIEATDANATPISTISDEYSYTVQDPVPFSIPYYNAFANQADYDEAVGYGFAFDNANQNGSYVRIINGSITTPAIDFSAHDEINLSFDLGTYGGNAGQELSVSVSNDNGANYTVLGVFALDSSTLVTFEQAVDLTSLNGTNGRIKFEMTGGSNSIRFNKLDIAGSIVYSGYVYENGAWTPSDPSGVTTTDDIYVLNGTADLNGVVNANSLFIMPDATLNVNGVLNLTTDLDIQGDIVFTSNATGNGELGSVGGVILGEATVQRYMSAQRSYRMVSSAVTTSTSINANWQEGVNNTTTDFQNNQDPNPGYGTHITGSTTGLNGFDATISGNPSMFTVNEAAQAFEAIGNTDTNTLNAGESYLLFVRGDRGINVASNTSIPTETVLRATGELKTGSVSQTFEMSEIGHFAMIGNPYQSSVDMESVLANSTNVNTNYYYIYDPTQATRGSYVTIDVTLNSPGQGDGNKYLQPGQGAQVASLAAGTMTINFSEADKAPGNQTATNATGNHSVNDMLAVQLFTTENFNNQGSVHDSFTMVFAEGNDNAVTSMDAVKPMNFDENFGRDHNGTYLSIERRAMPQEGEVFALYSSGYKNNSYTIKATVTGLEGSELYLHDQFTGNIILLDQGDINYTFEVDQDNPMSIATDRFSIQVQSRLGVEDNSSLSGVQLYPNPLNGSSLYVNAPKLNGEEVTLSINDMLGRLVYNAQHSFTDNATQIDLPKDINSGVYLVTLSSNGEAKTLRVIKQ